MERAPDCALLRPPLIQDRRISHGHNETALKPEGCHCRCRGTCRDGAWISGMGSGCLRRCEGSGLHLMGGVARHGRRRLPETAPRSLAGRQSTQFAAWRFEESSAAITVYPEGGRELVAFRRDPFRREMGLGLGCAIENFVLAARVFEMGTDKDIAKDGWSCPLARILWSPRALPLGPAKPSSDPLFDAIPKRRTHRGPYRDQSIAELLRQVAIFDSSRTIRVVFLTDDVAQPRD